MKNKLLITLGDSWTEGIGAYNEKLLEFIEWSNPNECPPEIYEGSFDDYKKNCWPTLLSKKLDYHLINLGKGGDSLSAQVKKFYEMDVKEIHQKYDEIFVICSSIIYSRISFYSEGTVYTYRYEDDYDSRFNLAKYYVENIAVEYDDYILENLFYIESLLSRCGLYNFKCYFVSLYQDDSVLFSNIDENQILNRKINNKYIPIDTHLNKISDYSKCRHPNKKGYALIAEEIFDLFTKKIKKVLDI